MTLLFYYYYIEIKASSCFHSVFFLKSHCLYNYFIIIQYLIKVKLLFSALVFTIISYIITDYHNLADVGVRCSYKGKFYSTMTKNITLSKPRSILQNTRACADNENDTITERTGKVKIREVETRA